MSAADWAWGRGARGNSASAATTRAEARPVLRVCRVILASKFPREVVFERELQFEPVAVEPIREVLSAAPLQLAPDQDVGRGIVEDVAERVVPAPEGIRGLTVGVIVVLERVADRGAVAVVPFVVDERNDADDGDRL